jgi:hypothetical protein
MGTRSQLRAVVSLAVNKRFRFTKQLLEASVSGGFKFTVYCEGWALPWFLGLLSELENPDNYEWDFTGVDWTDEDKEWLVANFAANQAEFNDIIADTVEQY